MRKILQIKYIESQKQLYFSSKIAIGGVFENIFLKKNEFGHFGREKGWG